MTRIGGSGSGRLVDWSRILVIRFFGPQIHANCRKFFPCFSVSSVVKKGVLMASLGYT